MARDSFRPEEIRFYGRRQGRRLRQGRLALVETVLPAIAIPEPPPDATVDPSGYFDFHPAAVWLEIGFGGGEHLANQALAHPDIGFIGCEPYFNGVASLIGHVADKELKNIRIFSEDARRLLPRFEEASIQRVFTLFSDPWPKARHSRRRFIQPETLDQLARILADGAELRFASDDMGYVRWALMHLAAHPAFEWMARCPEDWRRRPDDGFETRYEAKALRAGRPATHLRFRRRSRKSA